MTSLQTPTREHNRLKSPLKMAKQCEGFESLPMIMARSCAQTASSYSFFQTSQLTWRRYWGKRAMSLLLTHRLLLAQALLLALASCVMPTTAVINNGFPVGEKTQNYLGTEQALLDTNLPALESIFAREVVLGEAQLAPLPDNWPALSMLQAAADPSGEPQDASEGSGVPLQRTTQASAFPQGTTVLTGVNIAVNPIVVNGRKLIQLSAFKGGSVIGVFSLTNTTEAKTQLLQQLSHIAENNSALFEITWTATSSTSGTIKLKVEESYNAAASSPAINFLLSFRHVVGKAQRSDKLAASIAKEQMLQLKSIDEFKAWLASNVHPPLLKEAESFVIAGLWLAGLPKKQEEVKREPAVLPWLHQLATQKDPVISVAGELERLATIEITYLQNPTWGSLLKLKELVEASVKGNVPVSSLSGAIPNAKTAKLIVPSSWFQLTPEQQYKLWLTGKHPGAAGLQGELNITGLFSPQNTASTKSFFFFDHKGRPFGANSQAADVSLIGARITPAEQISDYVPGQIVPLIKATLVFPGGSKATHLLNPLREWYQIEKEYPSLRSSLAPKEPEKKGALLSVVINGTSYSLLEDFVVKHPTLLHLLADLADKDSSFALQDVILVFGASSPRAVKSFFIMETPPGVAPWCIFQYEVPITKRNTILIKQLMKKARRTAEAPEGCNIKNAKGLRFETITAVADIVQLQPELKTANRQQLNFKGNSAECKRLGLIFLQAYKQRRPLALFFSATHLLTATVDIPRIGKNGRERSPTVKTVTSRVHMNETYPELLSDFQKTFKKYKLPSVEFPYVSTPGGPERSALPNGSIPESWYHQSPRRIKLQWHSTFPILGNNDVFIDGNGAHTAGRELNIPIYPGTSPLSRPFKVIQHWLRQQIPNLQLPVDLDSMSTEDRNSLFSKIVIEVEGGQKLKLIDVLTPLLRNPRWNNLNPEDYKLPQHLLTLPIKNMFVEGDINFIVTTPEGAQQSHTISVRPRDSWGTLESRFFHQFPQYDRENTKLKLFDSNGNPVTVPPQSPVYVGVREAVEQRQKGLRISLETPLGKFTACYRPQPENNDCLVVSMHTVFCGKIKGISTRAEQWQTQCNAADMRSSSVGQMERFMKDTLRGADIFHPVKARDLLAIVRKHLISTMPDVVAQLNLPDPATSQSQIASLKAQIDSLRAKPQKTAEDYDKIQDLRSQIRAFLTKETKWAIPVSLTFFHVRKKGVERDLIVPIQNKDLSLSEEAWKLYHDATRQSKEAAMLDFANVYEFTFRVLGMEERQEVKKNIKLKAKTEKKAERTASEVKIKVMVTFVLEDEEAFTDGPIEISVPSDYLNGLERGSRKRVAAQLSKLYNIPKSYFTYNLYPRVVSHPEKDKLPVLKVALEVVCFRNDGTIGISPSELTDVLSDRGGYGEQDLVFIVTTDGKKLKVSIKTLRDVKPEKIQKVMFAWKRTLSEMSAKKKEKKKAFEGEKQLFFSVYVGDPLHWKQLLAPWLLRMRAFGPLTDTKIQLIVRNDQETNKVLRKSKCQVQTFGEILEYINDMEKLLTICPGLLAAVTKRTPFAFDVGMRSPPISGFRVWNRSHGDPERNRRYLQRLTTAFANINNDAIVEWKFAKYKGLMTTAQIVGIRALLLSNKPKNAALVREILAVLQVPESDIAKLTGRLNIYINHELTEQDKVLMREGVITMSISRSDGSKVSTMISAKGNPKTPVQVEVSPGDYSISFSLFSPTSQVSGNPCGILSSSEFKNLSWEKALGWCNLSFQQIGSLSAPFVWLEGVQTAMYPTKLPGQPVVSFLNENPMSFSFRRPGAPISSILPNDIYYNLVQQPGKNVPGATFVQKVPTPKGNIETTFNYFGTDPQRWGTTQEPGISTIPPGATAEFNVYPDPEQEESGTAFSNPLLKAFEVPGFSNLPGLEENFSIAFNPNDPTPVDGEVVYVQAPAGTGMYYFCPNITLQQFLKLKKEEEVAKLCKIPVELLKTDILVSSFRPGATPNYAPARQEVPVVLIDKLQMQHHYTVSWEAKPWSIINPLMQGGHPEDRMVFPFANTNRCVISRAMLQAFQSWAELARFCSATFEKTRPSEIVGFVQSIYLSHPIRISFPENLKQDFITRHKGRSLEDLFAVEPLGVFTNNILATLQPGTTLETTLEMVDGSQKNFNELPQEWRDLPGSQIPGLAGITVKVISEPRSHFGDTHMGSLQDLLNKLRIDGKTTFSDFVAKITEDGNKPSGMRIPSTNIQIGGTAAPGTPTPHLAFEMLQPETVGQDGKTTSFGITIPVVHGAVPETMSMENVIKMLHNPQILVHQKKAPEFSIIAMAGSSVPLTATTKRLDMAFDQQVLWLKKNLGIDDSTFILVTVVTDGVPANSRLSAAQLLGHTVASVLQLSGVEDLDNSHTVVLIGQAAPGAHPKKVSENQKMKFVVNGTVVEDLPGQSVELDKLLNIHVPGKGEPHTNFKFNIRSPSGGSTTQLVPADLLFLLQEISEMHGSPGLSLVLSFLNALKQVSSVAPGQTIEINTQNMESPPSKHPKARIEEILNTPPRSVSSGTYLVTFTRSGTKVRQLTVPITDRDKEETIKDLLKHLGIALESVVDLRLVSKPSGEIQVEDGSVDVGLWGQKVHIPVRYVSSKDKYSINELLKQMGQRLGSMLKAANVPRQQTVLHTVFTKTDGSSFTVDTPLGPTDEVEEKLANLTLWSLVPEEARHQHIKNISMSIQAEKPGEVPQRFTEAIGMTPKQKTWGTLAGQQASSVPNFSFQAGNDKIDFNSNKKQTVRSILTSIVSNNRLWQRIFWGKQNPGGMCLPASEFPYFMVMSTELGELSVPQGIDCLVMIPLPQFQAMAPNLDPTIFEIPYVFHEPPLQSTGPNGRDIYFSYTMELQAIKGPLKGLIDKAIGSSSVSTVESCLVSNPNTLFACNSPIPVEADNTSLESIASASRYVLVKTKNLPEGRTQSFLQRRSYLANINRLRSRGQ